MNNNEIAIIVVLYFPTSQQLRMLENAIGQMARIDWILVDNTPFPYARIGGDRVTYEVLHANRGVAYAQNRGIACARARGNKYVLFFDQDSQIEADFVQDIWAEYKRLQTSTGKIAALGPCLYNARNGKPYKMGSLHFTSGFSPVSALISSGTLAAVQTFDVVGEMDEALFIDYVDFEWCWRAASRGYTSWVSDRVRLVHTVGKEDRCLWGLPVIISSPVRYYYRNRNILWLARREYVPKIWKWNSILKIILSFVYLPFFLPSSQWKEVGRNFFKGIKAGIVPPRKDDGDR